MIAVPNSRQRLSLYYKQITVAICAAGLIFIIFTLIGYYLETVYPHLDIWRHNSSIVICGLYLIILLIVSRSYYRGLIRETAASEESEIALWESEEMQKVIIQASPAGVITINDQGIITTWNPATQSILGWSGQETLGKRYETVFPMIGLDKDRIAAGEKTGESSHAVLYKKDNTPVDVRIYTVPLQDVEGKVKGSLFLFTDITKELRAEEARHMAEVAKQREESLGHFLQVAIHELRNPITGLKGIVSLINSNQGVSGIELSQAYDLLQREVNRMSSLLNDVTQAFKAREGQLPINKSHVNLCDIVESSVSSFNLAPNGNKIHIDRPDKPIRIYGDPSRLIQALNNVISNAIKYSPNESPIYVKVIEDKDNAFVYVRDHGIGILVHQLEQIFEGFFRGSNLEPEKNDPGGMGLGLYICKQIVQNHGGRVWAMNNVNGPGSTFIIELPLFVEEEIIKKDQSTAM